jgi:hypothetical protein
MVKIDISYADVGSREYKAAEFLRDLLVEEFSDREEGRILIAPNVTCFGQDPKDIDIVIFAEFNVVGRNVWTKVKKLDGEEEGYSWRCINLNNFCFCIEVKDHDSDSIEVQDQKLKVKYRERWHDVTSQNEAQKYSLKRYLTEQIGWAPYICNFIWLRNVPSETIPSIPGNLLPSTPTFAQMLKIACDQKKLVYARDKTIWFSSTRNSGQGVFGDFKKAFSFFDYVEKNLGRLTREKLELITKKALLRDQLFAQSIGLKLVVVQGRPGTGKTIKLLHIAHDLCRNNEKRVLILTYNKALVSDIKRMVALARISSDVSDATIQIRTIHSFMYILMTCLNIYSKSSDTEENSDEFIDLYDRLKCELLEYIRAGLLTETDLQELMNERHEELAWDYVLVDEGQDWPEDERAILYTLFKPNQFVVADGISQLVRTSKRTQWTAGVEYHKPIVREKTSLRQKANLCRFGQHYAERVQVSWELVPRPDLVGGKVIIVSGNYDQTIHNRLLKECEESGNKPYEMLFLAPPSLVNRKGERSFTLTSVWNSWGLKIWDGTSIKTRTEYPNNVEEHRVLQYDSSRGLEGWSVVCLWMDDFISYKMDTFDPAMEIQPGLLGEDEARKDFAYKWSIIPITRAIDTLVITLRRPQSHFKNILREVYSECSDFVEWIE